MSAMPFSTGTPAATLGAVHELRMVPLASLANQFEGQVLGARLGAEGIVWQLRGACSVYPFGGVEVLVDADDLPHARELLLVDEVEAVFDEEGSVDEGPSRPSFGAAAFVWVTATAALLAIAARLSSWLWL